MIVFYTRYRVKDNFNTKALLDYTFNCVSGMRNVPDLFKNISWDEKESAEWKSDRNLLSYEVDFQLEMVAVRAAIVDQNDELWTMDIALNDKGHEIQLRLAREKKVISADYDKNFNVPYMFKKLIRDDIGGMDINLPVQDSPIFIDDSNLKIITDIINGNHGFSLPVIYVSHPFSKTEYEIDVEELAKDMAGSAHVLVEKDSCTSIKLRELTDSRNAYNGAIDVFYSDDVFRYMRLPEITANQFRYKITHAVYYRMAMRNIDDDSSLSAIRLRNKIRKLDSTSVETQRLGFEVEDLKAKEEESTEYIDLLHEELKSLEKKVNDLENSNFELRNKVESLTDSLNRKNGCNSAAIKIDYSEEQFYEDEIKRIVLECIHKYISSYGAEEKNRRDYHVLSDILNNNTASEIGTNIKKEMLDIFRKEKLNKTDISNLKGIGFELQQGGGHNKFVFHGDDRYIVTVSSTPSDHRDGENIAHEAVNLIFGRF